MVSESLHNIAILYAVNPTTGRMQAWLRRCGTWRAERASLWDSLSASRSTRCSTCVAPGRTQPDPTKTCCTWCVALQMQQVTERYLPSIARSLTVMVRCSQVGYYCGDLFHISIISTKYSLLGGRRPGTYCGRRGCWECPSSLTAKAAGPTSTRRPPAVPF